MTSPFVKKIVKKSHRKRKDEKVPELIKKFKLSTSKKNQFLAFLKPENFFDKSETETEKIVDLMVKKFEEFSVSIDGVAVFPGPTLAKFSIMDRHYGAINKLSKSASEILTKDDFETVHKQLDIKGKKLKILGGHEAFDYFGFKDTAEFDRIWLQKPSTKIRSGFYVRPITIKNEEIILVNGFHPHQLAYYTDKGRVLVVILASSDTDWSIVREKMLGDSFPERANLGSIRRTIYMKSKGYGFKNPISIANNILHISAGPTEFLFEAQNFFGLPFNIDVHEHARLSKELKKLGLSKKKIKDIISNQEVHSQLEHKNTDDAVELIRSLI